MLDAGVEIAREASVQAYLSFLRPEDVAAAADRSKSTFFHHWPSMADYIDDLVREAVSPMSDQSLAAILGVNQGETEREAFRRFRSVAAAAFDAFASNRNFPFFLLAAAAGDPRASEELGRANRELDERIGEILDDFLVSQGRSIRDPFTADIIVATFYAIGVGLATRARSDADRITGILFADVLAGLLPALVTSSEGDRLAFDDYVDMALVRPAGTPTTTEEVMGPLYPELSDDLIAGAAEATLDLRTHVVPEAEAHLASLAAEAGGWGIDEAIRYLGGLHAVLSDHPRTCLLTAVVVHASRVVSAPPTVADPLRDSGLDGVTRRALGVSAAACASVHLEETVRNLELRIMRLVYGGDLTPLDRDLDEARAIITLDA